MTSETSASPYALHDHGTQLRRQKRPCCSCNMAWQSLFGPQRCPAPTVETDVTCKSLMNPAPFGLNNSVKSMSQTATACRYTMRIALSSSPNLNALSLRWLLRLSHASHAQAERDIASLRYTHRQWHVYTRRHRARAALPAADAPERGLRGRITLEPNKPQVDVIDIAYTHERCHLASPTSRRALW